MARTAPLLKDDQWLKLEPLLPKMTPGKKGGRPWRNNRQVLKGILWVLKPERAGAICPSDTPPPAPVGGV